MTDVQLKEYTQKKHIEYLKKKRLDEIKIKYSKLIILDKKILSIVRIQRYIKRKLLQDPTNEIINEIPGLFRYRCKFSLLNTIDYDVIHNDDELILLIESLNLINNKDFWVMIDLRIYGENVNLPIYINDQSYYLNFIQKNEIRKIWENINPNTRQGLIYKQNIDYQRSQAKDMI
jgi:hypothetical protein